ncbi:outer membrane beta-barrel protein [Myroides sp. BIT-d1]|uniref:Outer membrane beta-barrel protein n=1 Tax=Myroides albus TaxID=2562892 RepID=A0A6I3LFI0_9FLAO|nr:outer membrane beta-barrel protein [Myroides albus]MTG98229.1 outer membrane beta-barrel protein [Myroides albus]
MSKDWKEQLRDKMDGFGQQAPQGLWEEIQHKLFESPEVKKAIIFPIEKQTKKAWYRGKLPMFGVDLSVAAAAIIVFLVVRPIVVENQKYFSSLLNFKHLEKIEAGKDNQSDVFIAEQTKDSKSNKQNNGVKGRAEEYPFFSKDYLSDLVELEQLESQGDMANSLNETTLPFSSKIVSETLEELIDQEKRYWEDEEKMATTSKNKLNKRGWTGAVETNGTFTNASQSISGYAKMNGNMLTFDANVLDYITPGSNPFSDIYKANRNKSIATDVKHKAPITAGVSIGYQLTDKWSLATGVTYTRLSSELKAGAGSNRMVSEQTIHFIGIPLQVNYNLFKVGDFSTYATVGTLFEKSVSGKTETSYIVNNVVSDRVTGNVNIKTLQVSANTAIGMQYKLSKLVGIYVEPGVQYHFENSSDIGTIYKEKPFNFNMKAGLRFNF